MNETPRPPSVLAILPAAITLALIGLSGLLWLVQQNLPTLWPRWLFYFLGMLAVTGMALPFVALLNRRFPGQPPATLGVITRQAVWIGVFFSAVAWLQTGRVANLTIAVLLGIGLGTIEWLLRLRERSLWKP